MGKAHLQKISGIYIFIIAISTFPILFITFPHVHSNMIPEMLFWVVLQFAFDYKPVIKLTFGNQVNELTLSYLIQLSVIILFGIGEAVWIVIVATLIVEILLKKPFYKILFNTGQYGLSLLVASLLFHHLKLSPDNITLDIIADMPAVLVLGFTYYLLNNFFVSTVIYLTTRSRFIDTFLSDFKTLGSYLYILTPISIAMSLLYDPHRPYVILIMVPPVIIADKALHGYHSLRLETQKTFKVLADIIDERDEYTFEHSSRVAEYAKKIAQYLNLPPEKIDEIETAGRVHDLGKVSIEDKILKKEGKLNSDEYETIKKHPVTAHRLLQNLKPYKKCSNYVLYHHERFDGRGYPYGISGKDIPLGARVLAVADSYDAMTTNRPYRHALPIQEAVNELIKCSGTQFDPEVVDAFIAILESDYGYKEALEQCSYSTR